MLENCKVELYLEILPKTAINSAVFFNNVSEVNDAGSPASFDGIVLL